MSCPSDGLKPLQTSALRPGHWVIALDERLARVKGDGSAIAGIPAVAQIVSTVVVIDPRHRCCTNCLTSIRATGQPNRTNNLQTGTVAALRQTSLGDCRCGTRDPGHSSRGNGHRRFGDRYTPLAVARCLYWYKPVYQPKQDTHHNQNYDYLEVKASTDLFSLQVDTPAWGVAPDFCVEPNPASAV